MELSENNHFIHLNLLKVEVKMYDDLNQYFLKRIEKCCYFTKEELLFFPNFVKEVKECFSNHEKWRNRLLIRMRNLFLMSQDQILGTDDYEKILKIEKKNQYELSIEELCDYLSILLSKGMDCLSITSFESQIKFYWQKDISSEERTRLLDLLISYSYEKLLPEEQIRVHKMFKKIKHGKSHILGYVSDFMEEIEKEVICISELEECVKNLEKLSYTQITEKELQGLKKLFQIFLDENRIKERVDRKEYYFSLEERIMRLYQKMFKKQDQDSKIREAIQSGEIVLDNHFSQTLNSRFCLSFDNLKLAEDFRIITIDDRTVPDKDGAFSIRQQGDLYILNVYITDVVSFLNQNRDLCKLAYERATSLYVRTVNKNERDFHIDMLPPFLSYKYLSLNIGYSTNCISFQFIFGRNGEVYSSSIGRNKVRVTDSLTPEMAERYLKSKEYLGGIQEDLKIYRELVSKVKKNSSELYLKTLNPASVQDLIAFPSIMVNYYLGYEAEFAIYREFGKYSKGYQVEPYTHSATPLRRFVSDINLAFFLEQQGVVSFSEKDLSYVERNIDEMIAHFNEQDYLQKFIARNCSFVRKYIKK